MPWRVRQPTIYLNLEICKTEIQAETSKHKRKARMKIVCIGGGPAGLYFALLMKKLGPDAGLLPVTLVDDAVLVDGGARVVGGGGGVVTVRVNV